MQKHLSSLIILLHKHLPVIPFRSTRMQIWTDTREENIARSMLEATKPDEDLPGLGQHFCISCSRYFVDQTTLELHRRSKPHKRRLKVLEETPHMQVSNTCSLLCPRDCATIRPRATIEPVIYFSVCSYVCGILFSRVLHMKNVNLPITKQDIHPFTNVDG